MDFAGMPTFFRSPVNLEWDVSPKSAGSERWPDRPGRT
ncbi:hypothetical protein BN2476_1290008 [Paraburkholderia piptadeniae]|uniref:Uncharacterized protein n=1 Tax=Paraburkholderia piptadeniae TaxID=1701573 RepID=A0A1N7SW18_9BURK|nr:hypothetical protein BN2476_1290008 [Paraburkholderia piptadeniae]